MAHSTAAKTPQADASAGPPSRYDLIAFAASAGGIPALLEVVHALPADLDVPVVVVQHRATTHTSLLPQILSRVTSLHVKEAEGGEHMQPRTIYIAPPDSHLTVESDRTLRLHDGRRIKFVLSSANPLLESAAQVLPGRVIAVVLTGGGSDGTDGVQAVKSSGGVVIAQDPRQAAHPSMPRSAISSGAVDYVVELAEIAPLLVQLTSGTVENR